MKQNTITRGLAGTLCLMAVLWMATGCGPKSVGSQGRVAILDKDTREHLDAKLNVTDFSSIAENLTNQMLSSPLVAKWGNKRPLIIVAVPVNNTHDENIRVDDIQRTIVATILNSGLARVAQESAITNKFDYILKSEITDTEPEIGASGEKLLSYLIRLNLYTPSGEWMGLWEDKHKMLKPSRSLL